MGYIERLTRAGWQLIAGDGLLLLFCENCPDLPCVSIQQHEGGYWCGVTSTLHQSPHVAIAAITGVR